MVNVQNAPQNLFMLQVGSLVTSRVNYFGIGKILQIQEQDVTVEYFCSVAQRKAEIVPADSVRQAILETQTRCYFQNQDTWCIGRVGDRFLNDEEQLTYQINLPDGHGAEVLERDLFVRSQVFINDPSDTLALKAQETPYFYQQRTKFSQAVIEQRAASEDLLGLLSANVELYPHQVAVVRQVVTDSVQRYILNDEAGLGKTIEAGVILRQYLLDKPKSKVLIVAPQALLGQWEQALNQRVYLGQFPTIIDFYGFEDWAKIRQRKALYDFVIVDQADRLGQWSNSDVTEEQHAYAFFRRLAQECDGLLLLTAKVLTQEPQIFLGLCHLLDTQGYPLTGFGKFKTAIAQAQTVGTLAAAIDPDGKPAAIRKQLKALEEALPTDTTLAALCEDLDSNLRARSQAKLAQRPQLMGHLQDYLRHTYRIHPRLIHTPRSQAADAILDRNLTPRLEYDLDERCEEIQELLEQWRTKAPKKPEYAQLFRDLFRSANGWLGMLEIWVTARLEQKPSISLNQAFGKEAGKLITSQALFKGEKTILTALQNLVTQPSEFGDRFELLKLLLLYRLADLFDLQGYRNQLDILQDLLRSRLQAPPRKVTLPKIVIFTNFTKTAFNLHLFLQKTFGEIHVAAQLGNQDGKTHHENWEKFTTQPACLFLVCDDQVDYGTNLQTIAHGVIHFDLPWSPLDLEKRLTRCDRIGSPFNFESWLMVGGEETTLEAWYQLLETGWQSFTTAGTALETLWPQWEDQLQQLLFKEGLYCQDREKFQTLAAELQRAVQGQHQVIAHSYSLDQINVETPEAQGYFDTLDQWDGEHQKLRQAVEGILCGALKFKNKQDPDEPDIYQYEHSRYTLVPVGHIKNFFTSLLYQKGTYNRRIANHHEDLTLYRLGSSFLDTLNQYVRWDDRGQAFAMWRYRQDWVGEPWLGFQFDYVLEPDLGPLQDYIQDQGINPRKLESWKRLAVQLFPPRLEKMFVDCQLQLVTDETLLALLHQSYRRKGGEAQDFNFAKERLELLDQFIAPEAWPPLCQQARQRSAELMGEDSDFSAPWRSLQATAQERLNQYGIRAQNRYDHLVRSELGDADHLRRELDKELGALAKITEGIGNLQVRLDAVGFHLLTNEQPAL